MKLLTINNAKKGLLLILKLLGFCFTAFFAFLDIVFGDPDDYDEGQEVSGGGIVHFNYSDSTAAGKPLTVKNVNNVYNEDWWQGT